MIRKVYEVTVNYQVDAPQWWTAARDAVDIPIPLMDLILCQSETAIIDTYDLRWCKQLPGWDGIDGWPLWLERLE